MCAAHGVLRWWSGGGGRVVAVVVTCSGCVPELITSEIWRHLARPDRTFCLSRCELKLSAQPLQYAGPV